MIFVPVILPLFYSSRMNPRRWKWYESINSQTEWQRARERAPVETAAAAGYVDKQRPEISQ